MQTKLQSARQRAGMTRAQLAEKAGVPLRTLEGYEQGRRDFNKAAVAEALRIAEALSVDVRELLD